MHHTAAQDADRPRPDEHEGHLPPGEQILSTSFILYVHPLKCIVQIPFSIEGQVNFTSSTFHCFVFKTLLNVLNK